MQIQNNNILLDKAISIIDNGRKKVIEAIYKESTKSYYKLGELIVNEEQEGDSRAKYGKGILENLPMGIKMILKGKAHSPIMKPIAEHEGLVKVMKAAMEVE